MSTSPGLPDGPTDPPRVVYTEAARRARDEAERRARARFRAVPLAEEFLVTLFEIGIEEAAFAGAVRDVSVEPLLNALRTRLEHRSAGHSDEERERFMAYLERAHAAAAGRPIDCLHLLLTLLGSKYYTPEVRLFCESTGRLLVANVLANADGGDQDQGAADAPPAPARRRVTPRAAAGTPTASADELPHGWLLKPGALPVLVGRDETVRELAERFAAGRDSLLVGPRGTGKNLIARWAAARSGRPAVEASASALLELSEPERTRRWQALGAWLAGHGAGLVLTDVERPLELSLPKGVPYLAAVRDVALAPVFAPPRRRPRILRPEPLDGTQLTEAVAAWYIARGGKLAIDTATTAVSLADRFLPGENAGAPGAAVDLLRFAERTAPGKRPDREILEQAAAHAANLPLAIVSDAERRRLNELEARLACHIVGQDGAIGAVCAAIRRRAVALDEPRRPAGIFLFVGPTGVGKTELARRLAIELYGGEDALLRFDMGEYQHSHEVAKFIGSPPGYIGSNEPGQLISALRERPRAVLLFDEIEKADPAVHHFLLGAFDYGVVKSNHGAPTSLRECLVIMTSNVGARARDDARVLGFGQAQARDERREHRVGELRKKAVRDAFSPEFLNRLDAVVEFAPLGEAELGGVLEVMLNGYRRQLERVGVSVDVGPLLRQRLVRDAIADGGGGRKLLRAFEREVVDGMASQVFYADRFRRGARYLAEDDGSGRTLISAA